MYMNLLVAVLYVAVCKYCCGCGGGRQKGFNTKLVFPRNLSYHMDWHAHTDDTVLVKCREMTGWSQTLPWWMEGGGVKTTEKNASAHAVGIVHVCILR
jgi:hypothetical protein